MMKSYSELISINDFYDRFEYAKLLGVVGEETFGFDRYLNQSFYKSKEWKDIRNFIIARDNGFDLSHKDFPIGGRIIIHHLNPISEKDILDFSNKILDPENLISVSHYTHEGIHFGNSSLLPKLPKERKHNDTKLW